MVNLLHRIADSKQFHDFILALIVLSGILVGLETYPPFHPDTPVGHILIRIQDVILWLFVLEAAIKIGSFGKRPWRYFLNPWNVFDFVIIAICFLPIDARFAMVFRMARLLRTLRLLTALPRLQVLVNALLKSIPSLGYVGVLLLLHFYMYAVMGTFLFHRNDPIRFGNLHSSMMTLFEVLTLEGWNDVFNTQMLGSDIGYSDEWRALAVTRVSTPHPVAAAAFFVSFIMLGTMIMLNLFTGVIINSMQEAQSHCEPSNGNEANNAAEVGPLDSKVDDLAGVGNELERIVRQLSAVSEDIAALKEQTLQLRRDSTNSSAEFDAQNVGPNDAARARLAGKTRPDERHSTNDG
jgi:voltage-gated sodium channel